MPIPRVNSTGPDEAPGAASPGSLAHASAPMEVDAPAGSAGSATPAPAMMEVFRKSRLDVIDWKSRNSLGPTSLELLHVLGIDRERINHRPDGLLLLHKAVLDARAFCGCKDRGI